MKLQKDDIIEIEWLDILHCTMWMDEDKASELCCAICKSLGYFLNQDKDVLRVSSTLGKDGAKGKERDVLIIPNGCIIKIRKLK